MSFFPRGVLDEILNLIESVSEGFPSYSFIPIPKPGMDKTEATNYRPIALTSCICKAMGRMINDRLVWFLEPNDLISKNQAGFCKKSQY